MVSNYILLRLKQFARFYAFSGIHPLLGIPATSVVFAFVSALLYQKLPYAQWVYCAMTIAAVTELQHTATNSFLKQVHTRINFFKIKLPENLLLLIPFLLVMVYYKSWWAMIAAIAFVLPYSYYNTKLPKPRVRQLPTPYAGYAYEANFGFRAMFPAYLIYVALLIVGCVVQNVYVLMVPFFILLFCITVPYTEPEQPMYVWMHRMSAVSYMKNKWVTLFKNYIITFMPYLLLGVIFYTAQWPLLLLSFAIGLIAVSGSMIIKYHFYQGGIIAQITQMIFVVCAMGSIVMPAMLVVLLLFMSFSTYKAMRNLKTILKC